MSRNLQKKNKDLVKLRVLTSDEVWQKDKKGKYQINKNLNVYGKVEKGSDCFVTTTNQKGTNHRFVENTVNLTKKTKNEIVDNFLNKNKRVVYLVEDKKS